MYSFKNVLDALKSEPLSEALFKLELFAKQQKFEELQKWASTELNGYGDKAPLYRQVTIVSKNYDGNVTEKTQKYLQESVIKLEDAQQEGLIQSNEEVLTQNKPLGRMLFFKTVIEAQEVTRVLNQIRDEALRLIQDNCPTTSLEYTPYPCPDFSALVRDADLAKILTHLWDEANLTFQAEAYLATVILLGSILEGVLLAKIQQNPKEANLAKKALKPKSEVPSFDQWKLQDMIEIAKNCSWVRKDAYDVFKVLQAYRNMVHPRKQMKEKFQPEKSTCEMAWPIIKPALDALQANLHHRSTTSPST